MKYVTAGGVPRRAMTALLAGAWLSSAAFAQDMVDGKLQPLANGFPNRPIVLLVVDEPGSVDSVFANQIAEAATEISPVPVQVEHRVDFSTFGTWEALAWLQDQGELADEGYIAMIYTTPDMMIDLLAVDIEGATGVGFDDLNTVIGTEQVPFVMVQRADAPWGDTLDDLVEYAKANPGTVTHLTGGLGSGTDAAMQVWLRELGIEVQDVPGGSTAERALAVAAGEADITVQPLDGMLPHYQAGRLDVLMASGDQKLPEPFQDLPIAGDFGMEYDPGYIRSIAVAPSVPDEHREWLFTLFSEASKNEDYLANRAQVPGLRPVIYNHDELTQRSQAMSDLVLPVYKEMGRYWADQ